MIKVERIGVYNIENAIRGMRNPLKSWNKSDSFSSIIGEEDMELATKLIKAGNEHAKFMRQIFVSMDITAPDYWWKEYATYKVSTTENSTSTMHKITSELLDMKDFSIDEWDDINFVVLNTLNQLIEEYQEDKYVGTWKRIIQLLPMSYNYLRTCSMNYQVLRNMYFQRRNHKLVEWREFCKVIESLPYSELITVS